MFVAKIKILRAKSSLNILPGLEIMLSEDQHPHPATDTQQASLLLNHRELGFCLSLPAV